MSRLFRTAANVAVASAVHGRVRQRQHDRWAANQPQPAAAPVAQSPVAQIPVAQTPEAASPVASAPAATPSAAEVLVPEAPTGVADVLAQLTQLGQLRAAGVLTDAEFETQKARILAA